MNEERGHPGTMSVTREPAPVHPMCHAEAGASGATIRPSHQRILDVFDRHGAMTPDELAAQMGRSVFYSRPRCSELRAMGLLHPTGETRENPESGLRAAVLRR